MHITKQKFIASNDKAFPILAEKNKKGPKEIKSKINKQTLICMKILV
jgi:hypothetical protein